jgi:hypothetical protein
MPAPAAPFAPLPPAALAGVEAEAASLGRFLDLPATLHLTPPA